VTQIECDAKVRTEPGKSGRPTSGRRQIEKTTGKATLYNGTQINTIKVIYEVARGVKVYLNINIITKIYEWIAIQTKT